MECWYDLHLSSTIDETTSLIVSRKGSGDAPINLDQDSYDVGNDTKYTFIILLLYVCFYNRIIIAYI